MDPTHLTYYTPKLIFYATKRDHATPFFKEHGYCLQMLKRTWPIIYLSSSLSLYSPAHTGLRSSTDKTRLTEHKVFALYNLLLISHFNLRLPNYGTVSRHICAQQHHFRCSRERPKISPFHQMIYLLFRGHCFPFLNFFISCFVAERRETALVIGKVKKHIPITYPCPSTA